MNKVSKMALQWLGDGLTEAKAVENVKDELVYDILEQYELELEDKEMAKLERVIRVAVDSNINWDEIEEACREGEAWRQPRMEGLYGQSC